MMERMDIPPTPASISAASYFNALSFPSVFDLEDLVGKSNFHSWRSTIQPILLSNPHSSDLILGNWPEPTPPLFPTQTDEEVA